MKFFLTACLAVLTQAISFGQNFEKIVLDEKDAQTGYYLAVKPRGPIEGVLVLFPGFGESAEATLPETKLHNTAFTNNILTLIIPNGPRIYADDFVVSNVNRDLKDSITRFRVGKNKFVLGGFSAGGTIALRYAERCNETPELFPLRPRAVFTVDSPVDLLDLWKYFDRELARNFSEVGMAEARAVQGFMTKDFNGTPSTNPAAYSRQTPFEVELNRPGNEKYLYGIPVRVYHDLDVTWQLKNRRRGLLDNNATAASELIARLMLNGNSQAEFMISKTPGYRSNGMRHTHSWSIVDEVELIQWMKGILKS